MTELYNLVADIGGTNSRFALCRKKEIALVEPRKYPNKDFHSLEAAIKHYIRDVGIQPESACLAVAGPVNSDDISLTNIEWSFNIGGISEDCGFKSLKVVNDFAALAMSVPHENSDNIRQMGNEKSIENMPIAVLGPGTGLGVSCLISNGKNGWVAVQGEGGNTAFSPRNDMEIELLKLALKDKGFVRAEDFISGMGLVYLHELLLKIHDEKEDDLDKISAKDITWRANASRNSSYKRTLDIFCRLLGSFAGDAALTFGAFGGVYIGGGVTPQLGELFFSSGFREAFEDKGRFESYVSKIPTYVLLSHSRAALLGAAAVLKQESL